MNEQTVPPQTGQVVIANDLSRWIVRESKAEGYVALASEDGEGHEVIIPKHAYASQLGDSWELLRLLGWRKA